LAFFGVFGGQIFGCGVAAPGNPWFNVSVAKEIGRGIRAFFLVPRRGV